MNRNESSSRGQSGETSEMAAQSAATDNSTRSKLREPLQDPTTKFPKPPFRKQSQPWPGLASKMDPKPDHGERSYRGSGRLQGRKALVTGGDFGHGPRRGDCLRPRGSRCGDQLSSG